MQHFINDIQSIMSQSIDGYLRACGGGQLARLESRTGAKILLRRELDRSKVSLVSGGGSGHEPAHVGFVGRGMLTAAVCGEIFASPTVEAVLEAIRAVTGPAGCLLIVKNYAGDRLNFGLAAEKARAEGLNVEMVIVADDIAIKEAARPRGIAGTLLVHKLAGHAAESGADLASVKAVAEKTAADVESIGIAITVCNIPGRDSHERLPDGMAELGLGIHGEPGIERIRLPGADEVAQMMTARFGHGPRNAPSLAIMINNLGGLPAMEMSLLANAILETGIGRKARIVIGPAALMTALDMRGFSISVLPLDAARAQALQSPTSAPAWPGANEAAEITWAKGNDHAVITSSPASGNPAARRAIEAVCSAVSDAEGELNLLDAKVGDGDTGTTMANAARAVRGALDSLPLADPALMCIALGNHFATVMGGSSGVLLSIFATATGHGLAGGAGWGAALGAGLERMEYYGGAKEGDRTMLDALRPAVRALESGADISAAAQAAEAGAAKTALMNVARAGRSSYLAAADLQGVRDPGAAAMAMALKALAAANGRAAP